MLLSPPPASPVNKLLPLCTEAIRVPVALWSKVFILETISIKNNNCPSDDLGMASASSKISK